MVKVDPGRCKWLATGAGLAGSPSKKRSKTVATRIPFFTLLACQDDRLGQEVAERQLECLIKSQASRAVKGDSQ